MRELAVALFGAQLSPCIGWVQMTSLFLPTYLHQAEVLHAKGRSLGQVEALHNKRINNNLKQAASLCQRMILTNLLKIRKDSPIHNLVATVGKAFLRYLSTSPPKAVRLKATPQTSCYDFQNLGLASASCHLCKATTPLMTSVGRQIHLERDTCRYLDASYKQPNPNFP